ncbi:YceD family protein [Nocardioides sp. CPCC 205120]|uniref:YceD family protein n=1 Tax=Nocardioides sp. CPCC 205120 TaxID=3406462 RepID=UPI003B50710A
MIDTRELGRRAGSQHEVVTTVPAPADLGIEVLGVPEGSPVELDLRLEAVMEGVLVTGTAHVELVGECVRCLEEITDDASATFQELFVYDDGQADHGTEDDDDLGVRRLEDDLVDLEPSLRDAVVLALPFQPLCSEDCPGLCVECGARLADDPGHTHGEAIDPRWAGLTEALGSGSDGTPGTSAPQTHDN